ncbi:hypothetical protein Tco_1504491, partial [Tanacetum coccineum]
EDEFQDDNPPPPPLVLPTQQATPHTLSTIKLPILKKGKWSSTTTYTNGQIRVLPPKTAEEILARERERKARTTLLMSILEDHLAKFHKMTDAKEMWEAVKSRFGGNDESKKMQKYILKQQFESFSVSPLKMPIRSFLGLYLLPGPKVFESDVKGSTASSSSIQNVAFVSSESTNSTNDVSIAYGVSTSSGHNSQKEGSSSYTDELKYSFFANQSSSPQLDHEDLEQAQTLRFMKVDLDDKTNVLTCHKKLLAEAVKEKEELKTKLKIFKSSSKGLSKLLNIQMSVKDKFGLGYGDQIHKGVLSYENEVLESVFDSRSSDVKDSPVYDRFAKVEGMHAVPPPMTGIYMPPKSDLGIDELNFTYGPKQSKTSEFAANTSDSVSYESNSSKETLKSVPKPAVNEPKVVSKLKVWFDAPIIEEYEETVKEQNTCSPSPKADKRDWNGLMSKKLGLGYGFTKKACFVCGSFSHLIRDCDFHEKKMAKQVELNKQKGKGTGQGENRPVWNNVQRLNHQNKFVPKAVLTKIGIFPINAARQNPSSQAAETSTARKVNTARPIMNEIKQRNNFYKSHSPIRRPFNKSIASKANFTNPKVNTVGDKTDDPQKALKNKRIVDSGCSRHMTGNKAYLVEYQDYNGGLVAFGGSKGQITGKDLCQNPLLTCYLASKLQVPLSVDNPFQPA